MIWSRMTAVLAIGLSVSLFQEHALADTVWSFSTGGTETGAGAFGNTRTYTGGSINALGTAWSDTGNTGTLYNSATATIQSAYLGTYGTSGLGVTNQDGTINGAAGQPACTTGATQDCAEGTIAQTTPPEHAVDNNGRYDSVVFNFGAGNNIQLTGVGVGYTNTDADISLLACDPTKGCDPTLTGKTYAALVASGWTLVGSYADLTVSSAPPGSTTADVRIVNGGTAAGIKNTPAPAEDPTSSALDKTVAPNTSAQYWLITAFNPTLSGAITGFDAGNDYFKLLNVYGNPGKKAPEPDSLALLGILVAGAVSVKRFKKKAQPTLG